MKRWRDLAPFGRLPQQGWVSRESVFSDFLPRRVASFFINWASVGVDASLNTCNTWHVWIGVEVTHAVSGWVVQGMWNWNMLWLLLWRLKAPIIGFWRWRSLVFLKRGFYRHIYLYVWVLMARARMFLDGLGLWDRKLQAQPNWLNGRAQARRQLSPWATLHVGVAKSDWTH